MTIGKIKLLKKMYPLLQNEVIFASKINGWHAAFIDSSEIDKCR